MKLGLLLKNKEFRNKLIAVILGVLVLFAGVMGSCNVVRLEDVGMQASALFSINLMGCSEQLAPGDRVNAPLLYACYAVLFNGREEQFGGELSITSKLTACFLDDRQSSALTDPELIFDRIEQAFDIHLNPHMRQEILALSEHMPDDGMTDRSILTRNLVGEKEKTNIGLCNFAYNAKNAGSGYVYGAFGQDITMAYLRQQQRLFRGDSYANLTESEVQYIYDTFGGRPAFDCIGLIKAYQWLDTETGNIRYGSNGFQDRGANATYGAAYVKGSISTIPEIPGLGVWMDGHIGVYIGRGVVIEAQGNHSGVVESKLSGGGWTHWLQLPGLKYVTSGTHQIDHWRVTIENGRAVKWEESPVDGSGDFLWPLPAPYGKDWITSTFEGRWNPVHGGWEDAHGAIDIGAPAGTPIFAAADGTVIISRWSDSYGNWVKIEHGNTYSTVYAHASRLIAREGQRVRRGDTIALVGTTGWSTGNHLHFEVRKNDVRIDPLQFF